MDDITKKPEFQRLLEEAAQYRVLREVVNALDRDSNERVKSKRGLSDDIEDVPVDLLEGCLGLCGGIADAGLTGCLADQPLLFVPEGLGQRRWINERLVRHRSTLPAD